MSGAGRSAAADVLEDLGFFVIDNLPPALIAQGRRARHAARDGRSRSRSSSTCAPASSSTSSTRRSPSCARSGATHPRPVPRRRPTTCSCAATRRRRRQHPLADGDRVSEGIAARAAAARGAEGRRRPRRRHVATSTCTSCATGCASCSPTTDEPTARCRPASCRSATSTACPLDVDLVFDCRFLPEPALGRRAAPAPRHRRAGARLRARPARGRGVPRRARAAARAAAPRLRARGQVVPVDRHRLHRRSAPQRRDRRRARATCSSGSAIAPSVHHRDVDRD